MLMSANGFLLQVVNCLTEANKKTCIIEQTNRFGNLNIESHGEIILYEDIKLPD